MNVKFKNSLRVTQIESPSGDSYGLWQLANPFYVWVYDDDLDKVIEIYIPENLVTDFVSTPRIAFAYLLFGGFANEAGVLHDALYSDWAAIQCCDLYTREPFVVTKAWADLVLYAALIECRVSKWKASRMWLAVKLFGGKYFHCTPALPHGVPHYKDL